MPYDGSSWDETNPTNATPANEIDDIFRDVKIGMRSRLGQEHIWPSSQSATANAGPHSYITFQNQTGAPTLPIVNGTTQCAGIYFLTNQGYLVDSAGTSRIIFASGGGVTISATATLGAIPVVTGSGSLVALAPGSSGYHLVSSGTAGAPFWRAGFGTPTTGLDYNVAYQATQDGLVFLLVQWGGSDHESTMNIDGSNPPTTVRGVMSENGGNPGGGMFPIKSGQYFKLTGNIPTTQSLEFWPL